MLAAELYKYFLSHPNIVTDTRKLDTGCIFWALKGDKFDGNAFATEALNVAAYAVVDNPDIMPEGDERYLLVTDTLSALQVLATHHREQLKIPIIAIAGSNGKTTTKELLAAALGTEKKVLATAGNLNNHIGLPLTILQITTEHEVAVLEIGANHIGENARLCEIARPDIAIITNTGKDHLEGFGGVAGVIKANEEVISQLDRDNAVWIRNLDDDMLPGDYPVRQITYSMTHTAAKGHFNGAIISKFPTLSMMVKNEKDWKETEIATNLAGSYNCWNVLATVATCSQIGIEMENVAKAIAAYRPGNNRSQLEVIGGNTYVMDAYNANPSSMAAAIADFNESPAPSKILMLGDMFELGRIHLLNTIQFLK